MFVFWHDEAKKSNNIDFLLMNSTVKKNILYMLRYDSILVMRNIIIIASIFNIILILYLLGENMGFTSVMVFIVFLLCLIYGYL